MQARAGAPLFEAGVSEDTIVSRSELEFDLRPHPHPVAPDERAALLADPGFGRIFTDHMVLIRFDPARGWHDASVQARAPVPLDPAAAVLHYAQEIFEGLKAYRTADGGAALFRPDANARRFRHSAERLAMAPLPEPIFVEAVRQLVLADRDWIPDAPGGSLYLRPFMISSEVFLGVKPSANYLFMVIASPVGSYFKGKSQSVSVWISDRYTRAAHGGTGDAKSGGVEFVHDVQRDQKFILGNQNRPGHFALQQNMCVPANVLRSPLFQLTVFS